MTNEVRLRSIEPNDLPIFYEQQLDVDATRMAGFAARDRAAFDTHWAANILGNPRAVKQTILVDGQVAGDIGSWPQDDVRLVGYWIGKEHWGKGVATRALAAFLRLLTRASPLRVRGQAQRRLDPRPREVRLRPRARGGRRGRWQRHRRARPRTAVRRLRFRAA